MKLYLVRHGITQAHEQNTRQIDSDELSDQGRRQARDMAIILEDKRIDLIISSTTTRASETAEIIREHLHIKSEVIHTDLFKEEKRPIEITGKNKNDPEIHRILSLLKQNASNPEYRFSDEETFNELVTRAKEAEKFLRNFDVENILIASHGTFGKLFLAYLIFRENLTYSIFEVMRSSVRMGYAGFIEISEDNDHWMIEEIIN